MLDDRPTVRLIRAKKPLTFISPTLLQHPEYKKIENDPPQVQNALRSALADIVEEIENPVITPEFLNYNVPTHPVLELNLVKIPEESFLQQTQTDPDQIPNFDQFLTTANPKDVHELQQQFKAQLKPEVLKAFQAISAAKHSQDADQRTHSKDTDSAPRFAAGNSISGDQDPMITEWQATNETSEVKFQIGPHDIKKLEWTNEIDEEYEKQRAQIFEGMVSELRFDFEGELIYPWTKDVMKYENYFSDDNNISGLRNHGLLPQIPGYSIPETLVFISSSFVPQKVLGLRILLAVLNRRLEIWTSRYMINQKVWEPLSSQPTRGFSLGCRRFDDYLSNSLHIHEKLMFLALSTPQVRESAIACIAAALAPRGSPLILLDENLVGMSPWWNGNFVCSRRGLLRHDDLHSHIFEDVEPDLSFPLMVRIQNGSTDRDTVEVDDEELRLRRIDPTLALLLWEDENGFGLENLLEYGIDGPILTILECLALHSPFAASRVVSILGSKSAILDSLSKNMVMTLSLFRALCSTLRLTLDDLLLNIVDILVPANEDLALERRKNVKSSIRAWMWNTMSDWLGGEILDTEYLVAHEILKWLPHLSDEPDAVATLFNTSGAMQKWKKGTYSTLEDSDLKLWTLLFQSSNSVLLMHQGGALPLASLLTRSVPPLLERVFASNKFLEMPENIVKFLLEISRHGVEMVMASIDELGAVEKAPMEEWHALPMGLATSMPRIIAVLNAAVLEPMFGVTLSGDGDGDGVFLVVLKLILSRDYGHGKGMIACGESRCEYSEWNRPLSECDRAGLVNPEFHDLRTWVHLLTDLLVTYGKLRAKFGLLELKRINREIEPSLKKVSLLLRKLLIEQYYNVSLADLPLAMTVHDGRRFRLVNPMANSLVDCLDRLESVLGEIHVDSWIVKLSGVGMAETWKRQSGWWWTHLERFVIGSGETGWLSTCGVDILFNVTIPVIQLSAESTLDPAEPVALDWIIRLTELLEEDEKIPFVPPYGRMLMDLLESSCSLDSGALSESQLRALERLHETLLSKVRKGSGQQGRIQRSDAILLRRSLSSSDARRLDDFVAGKLKESALQDPPSILSYRLIWASVLSPMDDDR